MSRNFFYPPVKIEQIGGNLYQYTVKIDGAFWLVKDDVGIIDPDFPGEFESFVRQKFGDIRMTEKVYVEADAQTQEDAICMTDNIMYDRTLPCRFNESMRNARKDRMNYNGRIVFGSVGFKQEDGTIKWVYGGENWETEDFCNSHIEHGIYPEIGLIRMETTGVDHDDLLKIIESRDCCFGMGCHD